MKHVPIQTNQQINEYIYKTHTHINIHTDICTYNTYVCIVNKSLERRTIKHTNIPKAISLHSFFMPWRNKASPSATHALLIVPLLVSL